MSSSDLWRELTVELLLLRVLKKPVELVQAAGLDAVLALLFGGFSRDAQLGGDTEVYTEPARDGQWEGGTCLEYSA